jgi:hypothetical protein
MFPLFTTSANWSSNSQKIVEKQCPNEADKIYFLISDSYLPAGTMAELVNSAMLLFLHQ